MELSESQFDALMGIIQPLAQISGLELVDIVLRNESGQQILDVAIDKEGGLTIDDCATLSRKISLVLDVEDPISFSYHLEVGSPGIFRRLKTDTDIEKNLQARVKAVFIEPLSGHKKFVGTLTRFQDRKLTICGESEELIADLEQIKKIQLFPDI